MSEKTKAVKKLKSEKAMEAKKKKSDVVKEKKVIDVKDIVKEIKSMDGEKEKEKVKEKKVEKKQIGESNYWITRDGKVWSTHSKRYLNQTISNGYKCITISVKDDDKNRKVHTVHRLMAEAFIPNPEKKKFVTHINGDIKDNRIENLEWVTKKESTDKHDKDISHPRKVIQKDLQGNIIKKYETVTEAGTAMGVTRHAISKACLGINKTCNNYKWEFEDDQHNHEVVDVSKGKKIDGYENYYVFENGKIYNTARKSYLKPVPNASGYSYVTLCKNKKKNNKYVHRLVAEHYLDNPDKKPQVNHKNKNRSDNRKENLEWVTESENVIHAKT